MNPDLTNLMILAIVFAIFGFGLGYMCGHLDGNAKGEKRGYEHKLMWEEEDRLKSPEDRLIIARYKYILKTFGEPDFPPHLQRKGNSCQTKLD